MDGNFKAGWYVHPAKDLIKVFMSDNNWVYQCYTSNAQKPLSKERPMDNWTWALSQQADIEE